MLAPLLLVGCATYSPVEQALPSDSAQSSKKSCQNEGIVIDYDFDNARVNGCVINDGQVVIKITPENKPVNNKPINNSPWYAFKASSLVNKELSVVIKYSGGDHRYSPKISKDRKHWQAIRHSVHKGKLKFKVQLTPKPVFVAGQEIITNEDYLTWMDSLSSKKYSNYSVLGQSTQDRQIGQIEFTHPDNKEWVVVLGRMHPPELTGALALFPFVENLIADQAFRERFNVLVIPNLNPDGVAMGNWRHNANGIDLNRDWKQFKQVESRLVRDKLNAITHAGDKIVFALDFHSTHKDIFYTMPSSYGLNPPHFVENWLGALEKSAAPFVVRQQPGNNPDKGVFKQYIADTFKVHAITYEMGDNTDRAVIDDIAKQASRTLMDTLMTTSPHKFKQRSK